MKKLLALAVFLVSPFASAQHEHDAQSTQAPMMMPMMMMMGDPEMQKMMMEHMQRCRDNLGKERPKGCGKGHKTLQPHLH